MTEEEIRQTELFCEAIAIVFNRLATLAESPVLARAGLPAEDVRCIRGIIQGEAQRAFRMYCRNKETLNHERNNREHHRCVDSADR
jgi:hypothetical protein